MLDRHEKTRPTVAAATFGPWPDSTLDFRRSVWCGPFLIVPQLEFPGSTVRKL